jgi:hypothetical protein
MTFEQSTFWIQVRNMTTWGNLLSFPVSPDTLINLVFETSLLSNLKEMFSWGEIHIFNAFIYLTLQHSQPQPPQHSTQQPLPIYYVPPALPAPPPPSGPMLNTSPPQQANSNNCNQPTPRYVTTYPPYQQVPSATQLCHPNGPSLPPPVQQETHQDRPQQNIGHSGMYTAFMSRNSALELSPRPETVV